MPGGQYTNLYEQARALGLADRWSEVCSIYADVNRLFGDIVKVTPTSKAVGDMALLLVANELTVDELMNSDRDLAFPESVIDLISGAMGQPPGGFPEAVKKRILKDRPAFTDRPGAMLSPVDWQQAASKTHQLARPRPNASRSSQFAPVPESLPGVRGPSSELW